MPNLGCNLECVKESKGDEVVEFVGPVKIILVDQPKHAYRRKIWKAAFIALAQMLMAITFLILQLCLPMGVLTLNNLNGAAAPMKLSDRKFEHGILQIFGLLTTTAGSIVSFFSGYPIFITVHSCLGMTANGLALFNGLVGIIIYIFCNIISKDYFHKCEHIFLNIHHILGVLTIILSSICFISGIIKDSFIEWLPLDEIFYSLIIFCIFYTIVVIYKPLFLKNS